jgi:hypothetical protein
MNTTSNVSTLTSLQRRGTYHVMWIEKYGDIVMEREYGPYGKKYGTLVILSPIMLDNTKVRQIVQYILY